VDCDHRGAGHRRAAVQRGTVQPAEGGRVAMAERIKLIPYLLFHPFDGFFEARFRNKGSRLLATAVLALYGIIQIITAQYTGFVNNFWHLYDIESVDLIISGVLPVVLFIISNWSVTTLMNGNGRLKDVYMVTCYSLIPLIIFSLITTVVSNVLIIEELPILQAVNALGMVWFAFLLFSGLCVVHEFSPGRTVLSLFSTVVAALIMVFLIVLYLTLLDKVKSFIEVIAIEISKRWR
jgi:hypothetical protein